MKNNMFNPTKHGFCSGQSSLSQLLNHCNNVIKLLEEVYNVNVVYLDFSKAFDKLDFSMLLEKIKKFGINGQLARWLYSFFNKSISVGTCSWIKINTYRSTIWSPSRISIRSVTVFLFSLGT